MTDAALRKRITNHFKISGFAIRSEICSYLCEHLKPLDAQEASDWLEKITNHIQDQGLSSSHIEKKHIESAIQDCTSTNLDENESIFSVINAFDVPNVKYCVERKRFILDTTPRSVTPSASAKADYIKNRYMMLHQRIVRHELFAPKLVQGDNRTKKFTLKSIENLLSITKLDDVVVLGLLTQLTEGKVYIEDPTGVIALDLTEARFHSGLFCEGAFVLVEGSLADGIFKVAGLGFPPPEPAVSSRAYFGTINSWGGPSKTLLKQSSRLAAIEETNAESTIVFLSDCWLDVPEVMEKLKYLFVGYDECPPQAIVLMGPFMKSRDNVYQLKSYFQKLGDIMGACEDLRNKTDLVLVPSMEDDAVPNIFPRKPLPSVLVVDLKRKYPRTILATNPCRMQYCTQQIVVCRSDLVTKFCRNALQFPETGKIEEHFAHTLICQGNLSPLHPIAMPTFWEYDAALSLYPLPDLIVIGDTCNGFQVTQHECTVVNTGSFPKSQFSFKVYLPANRTVEDSQVPSEDTINVN